MGLRPTTSALRLFVRYRTDFGHIDTYPANRAGLLFGAIQTKVATNKLEGRERWPTQITRKWCGPEHEILSFREILEHLIDLELAECLPLRNSVSKVISF